MTLPTSATSPTSRMPSIADPSTDMPTVWAPMPSDNAPAHRDSGRNVLALVSLLASLIFPLNVAVTVLGIVAMDNHLIPEKAMSIVFAVGGVVGTLGFPAMLTAIATGHVALVIAKRYSRHAARRWMAIVGLIVGYLSLLASGSIIALFLIAGLNGF